jgi:hypothetical protein
MAEDKKNIDRKIKESFEKGAPWSPRDLWSGLSEQLDEASLDQQVEDAFKGAPSQAPDRVWAAVDRQLSIDRVWKGLKAWLAWRTAGRWTLRLLPLLLLGLVFIWQSPFSLTKSKTPPVINQKPAAETSEELSPRSSDKPGKASEQRSPNAPSKPIGTEEPDRNSPSPEVPPKPSPPVNSEGNLLAAAAEPIFSEDEAKDSTFRLASTDWAHLDFDLPALGIRTATDRSLPILSEPKLQKPRSNVWRLGFRMDYDRQWLSDNIYRQAQLQESLIASRTQWASNYAIFAAWSWRQRSSVEIVYHWSERLGQQYARFGEGRYLEEEQQFSFQKLSLFYRYNFRLFNNSQGPYWQAGLGGYYGFIDRADLKSPLQDRELTSLYGNRVGLGLELGQAVSVADFLFSYGLNGQWDINNFHRGGPGLPAEFNISRSYSLGFYLGVSYQLKKK